MALAFSLAFFFSLRVFTSIPVRRLIITAWKTMPEEEKRKIHIRPLCRNVGMMIATSGIIFLLSGAWYAFRKSGFLWCMVGWMVLSGADVYWIGKSGRYQSSGK